MDACCQMSPFISLWISQYFRPLKTIVGTVEDEGWDLSITTLHVPISWGIFDKEVDVVRLLDVFPLGRFANVFPFSMLLEGRGLNFLGWNIYYFMIV